MFYMFLSHKSLPVLNRVPYSMHWIFFSLNLQKTYVFHFFRLFTNFVGGSVLKNDFILDSIFFNNYLYKNPKSIALYSVFEIASGYCWLYQLNSFFCFKLNFVFIYTLEDYSRISSKTNLTVDSIFFSKFFNFKKINNFDFFI